MFGILESVCLSKAKDPSCPFELASNHTSTACIEKLNLCYLVFGLVVVVSITGLNLGWYLTTIATPTQTLLILVVVIINIITAAIIAVILDLFL